MASDDVRPRRLLIWIIAVSSAIEALFQAVDYLLDPNGRKAILWCIAAVLLLAAGFTVERYKQSEGE